MCNQYLRQKAFGAYKDEFSQIKLPLVFPPAHAAPNLAPQPEVKPTDAAPIFRRRDDGVELAMARWWLVPWWHRGKLKEFRLATFNARSETVATARTFRDAFAKRRCLIPADGWFEYTGDSRKDRIKWRVMPRHEDGVCFAGIWDRCDTEDAGSVDSFTMLMRDSAPPLDRLHTRQPVVLRREDWTAWLDTSADVTPLYALDNGDRFEIEQVSGQVPLPA
jgi:putative SOS response-associated peptidase YedK